MMNKKIFAAVAVLIIVTAFVPMSALSQTQNIVNLGPVDTLTCTDPVQIILNGITYAFCEETSVPPTVTPTSTITSTVTPVTGLVDPYPDAPECSIHPAGYHTLWNSEFGCHYTHTHGDNVADIENFFNMTYADLYGQQIGFPWSPEKEDIGQNHNGYRFWFEPNLQPKHAQEQYSYRNGMAYITAAAIQVHDNNAIARTHSYSMWMQTESLDGVVGHAYIAGMADSGCAMLPYKNTILPMPEFDPVDANGNSLCYQDAPNPFAVPYRAFTTQTQAEILFQHNLRNRWIWDFDILCDLRDDPNCQDSYNQLGFFNMRTFKTFGWVDFNDYHARHNLCDSPVGCDYVNTDMQVFNLMLVIPAKLDTDGDGLVSYTGFTDIQGRIDESCTQISATCVPVILDNVPVGYSNFSRAGGQVFTDYPLTHEWNIYFNGTPSGWVELP